VLEIVLAFFCIPGTLALPPIAPSLLDWESESAIISLGLFKVGGTEAVVGAEGDALPVAPEVEGPVLGPLELPVEAIGPLVEAWGWSCLGITTALGIDASSSSITTASLEADRAVG